MKNERKCPECKGRGRISDAHESRACYSCNRTGSFKTYATKRRPVLSANIKKLESELGRLRDELSKLNEED